MPRLTAARNAVGLTFFLNGLVFASWVSRIPEVRSSFDLTNGQLGLLLLAIARRLGGRAAHDRRRHQPLGDRADRAVRRGHGGAIGMAMAALGLGDVLA